MPRVTRHRAIRSSSHPTTFPLPRIRFCPLCALRPSGMLPYPMPLVKRSIVVSQGAPGCRDASLSYGCCQGWQRCLARSAWLFRLAHPSSSAITVGVPAPPSRMCAGASLVCFPSARHGHSGGVSQVGYLWRPARPSTRASFVAGSKIAPGCSLPDPPRPVHLGGLAPHGPGARRHLGAWVWYSGAFRHLAGGAGLSIVRGA